MNRDVERPIFIVGSGRSGTTIFYRILSGCRILGWFSTYTEKFPGLPFLASLNPLYQMVPLAGRFYNTRGFPKPVEAHIIWDMFHPAEDSLGSLPLTEQDVSEVDTAGLHKYIGKVLAYSRRSRFVNKNTRNTRRIRYLHGIFPDARFIHVIRDGRAVTNSFLNVEWWSDLPVWWADEKTPVQLEKEGFDPALIAARMWRTEVETVLLHKEKIPQEQYMEIRYEKLIQDPILEMKRVFDFCDLMYTPQFQSHIETFKIKNKNFKWAERLTARQISIIEKEIGPLMEQLRYF